MKHRLLLAFIAPALLASCATSTNRLSSQPAAKPINVEVLTKSTKSWNGATLPAYSEGQPEVTILKIVIQPGVVLPLHKHPIINAGVLTQGKLKVEALTGETLQLNAGDTIVELVNTWHRGINNGDEPVEIVVFYAGIAGAPLSIKKDQ